MSKKVLSESPINESFKNKSVLLTGATGLVGKLIVYKILKSVQSVKNVYILIRSKDGKCFRERFHDMMCYSYGLFETLDNSLVQKLIPIEGDIKVDGLGLKETDRNIIINNVSIVIHSAADVTFDTNLKYKFLKFFSRNQSIYF
jgi:fatty acyl-CoA reductase